MTPDANEKAMLFRGNTWASPSDQVQHASLPAPCSIHLLLPAFNAWHPPTANPLPFVSPPRLSHPPLPSLSTRPHAAQPCHAHNMLLHHLCIPHFLCQLPSLCPACSLRAQPRAPARCVALPPAPRFWAVYCRNRHVRVYWCTITCCWLGVISAAGLTSSQCLRTPPMHQATTSKAWRTLRSCSLRSVGDGPCEGVPSEDCNGHPRFHEAHHTSLLSVGKKQNFKCNLFVSPSHLTAFDPPPPSITPSQGKESEMGPPPPLSKLELPPRPRNPTPITFCACAVGRQQQHGSLGSASLFVRLAEFPILSFHLWSVTHSHLASVSPPPQSTTSSITGAGGGGGDRSI